MFHGRRARGMAKPRGVIDVVRAQKTSDFLRHVIHFIGHAACGDVKGEAAGKRRTNFGGGAGISFIP